MILPVSYMWQQLDGPQVTAIRNAIFEYWKSIFDEKLDYFNNISIETANDQHLTLLGLLSGMVRPTISEADKDYFYFTEDAEHNTTHGFSDLEDMATGGKFVKTGVGQGVHNVSLNEAHYRALLRAFVRGQGELGSLELLDDICYELTKLDLGDTDPFYRFVFMEGENIPSERAPGDVFLDMGNISDWHNPLHIYAVLRGVANSIYSPQPQLYISIDVSGACEIPVASPSAGEYTGAILVELTTGTEGAEIHYTTDNTSPTSDSPIYTGPIPISSNSTLRAIATKENYGNSKVLVQAYVIK